MSINFLLLGTQDPSVLHFLAVVKYDYRLLSLKELAVRSVGLIGELPGGGTLPLIGADRVQLDGALVEPSSESV